MTSDFQKKFFSKAVGNKLFTQEEFDAELQAAQAEIVAMAIQATKEAVIAPSPMMKEEKSKSVLGKEEGAAATEEASA